MAQYGGTINDVIRRLITNEPTVNKLVNTPSAPVTGDVNDRLTELTKRIISLETEPKLDGDYMNSIDRRLQALETRTDSLLQIFQKVHPLQEYSQSMTPPDAYTPRSDLEDYQAPDQPKNINQDEEITGASETVEETGTFNAPIMGTQGEWIMVTDEIRSHLVARMGDLQKAGMSYEKIGKLIGMGKGWFSEIHQGRMKKIHHAQYGALINIP